MRAIHLRHLIQLSRVDRIGLHPTRIKPGLVRPSRIKPGWIKPGRIKPGWVRQARLR
jgi:hypothetical protein